MANAADIIVNLVAKTGRFTAGMSRGSRAMRNFRRGATRLRRVMLGLGRVMASFGAPIAAGGLALLARAGIQSADALAKTSAKLGIAANDLAGLRFAAEQTGVQVRALDLGIQRMTRRIAEAAQGTGEAQGAIKELGLDAEALSRLTVDEQFKALADAFENVDNQSTKVRLGFKLFDSEGVALINTLAAGRAELDRFTDEAERLGLTLRPQQLRVVQEAADAQNRLGRAFTGLSQQLGATFGPAITAASNATADFVATITRSLPQWSAWAAAILGVERNLKNLTVTELGFELRELDKEIFRVQGRYKTILKDLRDVNAETRAMTDAELGQLPILQRVQAKLDRLNKRYSDTIRARIEARRTATATAAGDIAIFGGASAESIQRLEQVRAKWKAISDELDAVIARQERLEASGRAIFEQTRSPMERFIARMKEARAALDEGLLPGGEDTLNRLREQMLNDLIPAIEDAEKAGRDWGFTFNSALEDAIINGQKFSNVLDAIGRDIARIILRQQVTEPLAGLVSGLFPTRHIGGSVTKGRPYATIPGEVFVPTMSGKVMPRGATGGPNVNVNYTIDARGADEDSVIARMVPLLEQTVEATRNVVRQDIREGRLL